MLLSLAKARPLPLYALALFLFSCLYLPASAFALPDFEDDVTLGMGSADLRKLGAAPCAEAELCLPVLWGDSPWTARLTLRGQKLEKVVLVPTALPTNEAAALALEQLEEFALAPVKLDAKKTSCNAFALTRSGTPAQKAVEKCAKELTLAGAEADMSVWYVDEDKASAVLAEESLEKAAVRHGRMTAVHLSRQGQKLEMSYGVLELLMQNSPRR